MDYYNKYGQNRDLEKYLRLQRRSRSKSSSEGSLQNIEKSQASGSNEKLRKSLDKIGTEGSTGPDGAHKKGAKSNEGDKAGCHSASADESKHDKNRVKIQKTASQNLSKKSKNKSYNFSTESSIEIIFPSEFFLPNTKQEPNLHVTPPESLPKMLTDSGNQTDKIVEVAETVPDIVQTEASPLPQTPPKQKDGVTSIPNVDVSPASSIASNKVRLEWDSLADVGYKIVDMNTESSKNLSTFERSALVKFFAKRGLTFDDNLVIFATPDKNVAGPTNLATRDRSKIKESMQDRWKRGADASLTTAKGLSPATNKRLWEKALTKYRQKYGKPSSFSESKNYSLQLSSLQKPLSQSTPISIRDIPVVSTKDTRDACYNTDFLENNKDMGCQTSRISVEAKGIQVQDMDGGIHFFF